MDKEITTNTAVAVQRKCVAEHYPFLSIWFDNFKEKTTWEDNQYLSTHWQSPPPSRSFSMCFQVAVIWKQLANCRLIDRCFFISSWWTPTPLLFNLYDSHPLVASPRSLRCVNQSWLWWCVSCHRSVKPDLYRLLNMDTCYIQYAVALLVFMPFALIIKWSSTSPSHTHTRIRCVMWCYMGCLLIVKYLLGNDDIHMYDNSANDPYICSDKIGSMQMRTNSSILI